MNMTPIIQLQGIRKIFLTDEIETRALDEVDLEIPRGDFVAVSGPSGCGKSTLLSILGLLDSPTGGQYLLNGQEVSRLGNKELAAIRNREIGFIFQSFNLIGDLSVFENVELPLTYRGVRPIERIEWVNTALEKVGMTPRGRHYPSQLSGGQQQRVAVARALAGNPTHELLPLLMVRHSHSRFNPGALCGDGRSTQSQKPAQRFSAAAGFSLRGQEQLE
jgi:putative ABC transport system ATP-binding protein